VLVTTTVFGAGESGAINLTNNDMIVDYSGASVIDDIRTQLTSGHGGGTWNGLGINTATGAGNSQHNTGLGYAEATDLFTAFPSTFSGEPIDNTAVLVKYTFYGDSDLNGGVDLLDFNRLASSFGLNNKRWINGDSDYNLTVNLIDFNRLASAFGQGGLGPQQLSGSRARSGSNVGSLLGDGSPLV
jgi:hypothetical protein